MKTSREIERLVIEAAYNYTKGRDSNAYRKMRKERARHLTAKRMEEIREEKRR